MKNKLFTPDGVKDYLEAELYFKNEAEAKILELFHRYGYMQIKTPTIEYAEVFEGSGTIHQNRMFKLIDRNGDILTLRPDMTPSIGRVAASHYCLDNPPRRFCYAENAFRHNSEYQGKQRELPQVGVELIGSKEMEADAEVVALAVNALLAVGLDNFQIDLGHIDFLNGILEEAQGLLDENIVKEAVAAKEFTLITALAEKNPLPVGVKEILSELPMFIGGTEIIDKARSLTNNKKSIAALEWLMGLYEILQDYGVAKHISFDLSMLGQINYYTGLIFRGYAYGAGESLLGGGRYDNLLSYFGKPLPSVGFAIKVSELLASLSAQGVNLPLKKAETLLAYTKNGRKTALESADFLRGQGLFIENSFSHNLEENITYAKAKEMGGILFFEDEERVQVINIEDDTSSQTTVSELLKKGR